MPTSSRSFIKFNPALDRRRLAALMFTDIVGYSAIFHRDENLAMNLLNQKCNILREIFPAYGGKEIKTLGDGFFIEFSSILEAVKCAYEIQSQLYQRNLGDLNSEPLQIRIGIHLCDFISTDEDAFGNDVNISSRLEQLAPPGGICVSQQVVDQVSDKLDLKFEPIKTKKLKNIKKAVNSYSIVLPWMGSGKSSSVHRRLKKWVPRKLTLEQSFLWASLGGMIGAALCVWFGLFLPFTLSLNGDELWQTLSYLQYIAVLNPIFAAISWTLWLLQPSDRRSFYISILHSLGTLSLFTWDSDPYSLSLLIPMVLSFPLLAMQSLETDEKRVEILANVGFAVLTAVGSYLLYQENLVTVTYLGLAWSVSVAGYFCWRIFPKNGARTISFIGDCRRAVFGVVAAISLVLLQSDVWNDSRAFEFFSHFFAAAYPLVIILVVISRNVVHEKKSITVQAASKFFAKVSSIVVSPDAADEKISNVQEALCAYLDAERSTIYLRDLQGQGSQLYAQAVYGPTEKLGQVATEVAPDRGLIGRVIKTRSPLLIDDLEQDDQISTDERSHIKVNEYRTQSCLILPLIVGNETLGVITLSDKRGHLAFTREDLKIANLIAKDLAMISLQMRYQNMVDHFVAEKLNDLANVG